MDVSACGDILVTDRADDGSLMLSLRCLVEFNQDFDESTFSSSCDES